MRKLSNAVNENVHLKLPFIQRFQYVQSGNLFLPVPSDRPRPLVIPLFDHLEAAEQTAGQNVFNSGYTSSELRLRLHREPW